MKSYKVVEFGQPLQKVEEGNPAPQGAEVLVKVTAAGVCHSDVHLWEGFFDMGGGNKVSTQKTMNPPRTMGHEIVGEVVALGPDAKGAKVGDKAVVYPWIGCGTCWYCTNGREHLCAAPRALGVNKDGGYADHVLVPDAKYLYPYGNIPTDLACLYACSGITAFSAVKKTVGEDGGKPILVIGAGGVGLMGVKFAQSVLGRAPIVADIDEGKRKLALDNGAIAAIDPRDKDARKKVFELTDGTGVGAAIDFVGADSTAQFGVKALARGGHRVRLLYAARVGRWPKKESSSFVLLEKRPGMAAVSLEPSSSECLSAPRPTHHHHPRLQTIALPVHEQRHTITYRVSPGLTRPTSAFMFAPSM